MNPTNNAAPPEAMRRIVRRCIGQSLSLVLTGAALALILTWGLVKLLPGLSLPFCLEFALPATVLFAIGTFWSQQRSMAAFGRKPTLGPLLGVELRDAMEADLIAIGRAAGLKNPIQLCVNGGASKRLAFVVSWIGKNSKVRVYVPKDLPKLGLSRPDIKGLFGHEIGHALLASGFWHSFVIDTFSFFAIAILTLPAASLTGNGIQALTETCGFGGALLLCCTGLLICAVALMVALAATGAWLSRIHERAADQLSIHLAGPGLMASILTKRLRFRSRVSPHQPASLRVCARLWWERLMSTHPSDSERIDSSLQSV